MADNPSMTDYVLSFTAICAIMWFVPEPKLSAVCGLMILIGWDITFHLREIVALQKEQLEIHEQQLTKLTTNTIMESATEDQALTGQTLVLSKEMVAIHKEMLTQNKAMVSMQEEMLKNHNDMLDQQKEMLVKSKEMLAQHKEMVALQRRLVPATEMSATRGTQERIATILHIQAGQIDVALKKMGVDDATRPWVPPRR